MSRYIGARTRRDHAAMLAEIELEAAMSDDAYREHLRNKHAAGDPVSRRASRTIRLARAFHRCPDRRRSVITPLPRTRIRSRERRPARRAVRHVARQASAQDPGPGGDPEPPGAQLALLPRAGYERCPHCGHVLLWSGGRLLCCNPHCTGGPA
jgi:hypothetical protein